MRETREKQRFWSRLRGERQDSGTPPPPQGIEDFVIISGFSGAGKSQAKFALDDAGYFCVDNAPPRMILSHLDLFLHEGSDVERAAFVSDVRGGEYFDELLKVLDDLDKRGVPYRLLFLTASEDVLVRRFKETRSKHPLANGGDLTSAIHEERRLLGPVQARADLTIDTSGYSAAELRRTVANKLAPALGLKLAVTFKSCGLRDGPPPDSDLLFDVRFLPNPHYVEGLRERTGLDREVVEYVEGSEGFKEFYDGHLVPLLDYLLPAYVREGKSHLTVSIGCTGGRHRSVAIASRLAREYKDRGEYVVDVVHRDVDKPPRRP